MSRWPNRVYPVRGASGSRRIPAPLYGSRIPHRVEPGLDAGHVEDGGLLGLGLAGEDAPRVGPRLLGVGRVLAAGPRLDGQLDAHTALEVAHTPLLDGHALGGRLAAPLTVRHGRAPA